MLKLLRQTDRQTAIPYFAGDLLEDWRVFPLELKDTALIPFPTQAGSAPKAKSTPTPTPTFYRQVHF